MTEHLTTQEIPEARAKVFVPRDHRDKPSDNGTDTARSRVTDHDGWHESNDEAPEAVFEAGRVEIHQKPYTNFTHAEVGQDLGFMRRDQNSHCFDFKNNAILDNDVRTETQWDRYVFVNDRDCDLALEFNVGMPQLQAHAFRVHGFEQPRSDCPVYFDRKAVMRSVRSRCSSTCFSVHSSWSFVFSVVNLTES